MIARVSATIFALILLSACATQTQWTVTAVDPLSKPAGQIASEHRVFERETTIIHPAFSLRVPSGWTADYRSGHGTVASTEGVWISPFAKTQNAAVAVSISRVVPHKFISLSEVAAEVTKNTKKSVATIVMNGQQWITYSPTPNSVSYTTLLGSDLWTVIVATDARYPEYNRQAADVLKSIVISPPQGHAQTAAHLANLRKISSIL